jgi:putative membrane protein
MLPFSCATHCSRGVATVASEPGFVPDRRLHPLSWLFVLLSSIRQFIVPLIAVVIFGVRDDGSAWGALFVIPFVIAAIWRQYVYRYGFGPRGLVIRDGLLFRNVRQIEYERIENVDTQRGLLHRLMDVAEVRLESSRGGKPEALIRVLGADAVQELRERIFSGAHHDGSRAAAAAPEEQELLKLSPVELMRYGFVDNRGMLVVAAAVGVASQAGAINFLGAWLQQELPNDVSAWGLALALVAAGFVLSLVFLVRLLSLAWAVVALHDFTLSRAGSDLRIRYGLLTNVALTLRLPRIQAVHRTESILHRFFDRVSLHVDLAGGGMSVDEKGAPQTRIRMLAPICTPGLAAQLIRVALPVLERDEAPVWQPLAPSAKGRIFRKFVLVATLVCAAPAIAWFGYNALCVELAIVPLGWLHATRYVRHTRWALTREAVLFQRGWLNRRLSILPRSRVQVVEVTASPFDRRHGTAALVVDTAGAGQIHGVVRIAYMRAMDAQQAAQAIYASSGAPYRMAYA